MPIVNVEVVAGANDAMAPDPVQSLADAIGRALESPPGQTWVRVRSLARDQYAENEALLDPTQLPVFVTILKRQLPQRAELEGEITAVTRLIAQVIGRPAACVYIEYAPAAAGRLSFGRPRSMIMPPNLSLNPDAPRQACGPFFGASIGEDRRDPPVSFVR